MFIKTSLNRLRGRSILDSHANSAEQLFLAPPFSEDVVAAIRLISTRLPLKADERSRLLLQNESNAASQAEYDALAPLFALVEKPRRVLEIGPGFGRSVVFFSKKGLWPGSEISLYDSDGASTKYKQKYYDHPPKWPDTSSFCGNLSLLASMLDYNHVTGYKIFDAAQLPLSGLPGPYDLIYGFFSIGFHWSLEYYLDDLLPLLHERTLVVCTLNKNFKPFPRLQEFSTRVVSCREVKKNASPLRLLVLSKGPAARCGTAGGRGVSGINRPVGPWSWFSFGFVARRSLKAVPFKRLKGQSAGRTTLALLKSCPEQNRTFLQCPDAKGHVASSPHLFLSNLL